jgi:hypothetical protein
MKPRDFELKVRMNAVYHSSRYAFLVKWIRLEKIVLLLSMSATIALVKSAAPPEFAYAGAALAAVLTIWLIVSNADEACHEHRNFYSRWNSLHQKYVRKGSSEISASDLKELIDESAEISSEEPPNPITSLLIYSQNRVLREIGSEVRIEQSAFRRLLRNVYDGDADNLSPKYITIETSL